MATIDSTWRHPATGSTYILTAARQLLHQRADGPIVVSRTYVTDPVVEEILIRSAGYDKVHS